jgi:ElaB/YqjD/DUF883 family membrane-anchored ribosome-binding protein
MSNNPDRIRADIEQTRSDLSANVNALGEAVSPGNIARRQVDKVRGGATGLKDKVMGVADDDPTSPSVGDRVEDAGRTVRRKAQGNPLAAGLVALGAGWLVGSLIPASERERQAAVAAKEKAQPVTEKVADEVKTVAQDVGEQLKQPAQESAEALRSRAQDAVQTVRDEGQDRAEQVKASAEESTAKVQEHQARPDTTV